MSRLTARRTVDAPAAVAWAVITDHELYAEVAPNLADIEVLDGDAEGLRRRCVDTDGNAWTETVNHWDEGRAFGVTVDTENSAFHRRFFRRFEGRWGVDETPSGVDVWMAFEWDTRWGPIGWLVSAYLRYRAPGLLTRILDGWAAEMEARIAEADSPRAPSDPHQRSGSPDRVFR